MNEIRLYSMYHQCETDMNNMHTLYNAMTFGLIYNLSMVNNLSMYRRGRPTYLAPHDVFVSVAVEDAAAILCGKGSRSGM